MSHPNQNAPQPHLFCFGLGFSAHHLAARLLEQGWRVSGTHRSMDACEDERTHGITAYLFDEDLLLENIWDLQTVTHILISIPPSLTLGDLVLHHHLRDLQQLPNLQWIGYLSTTGVYGDHQGAWVDETTPTNPFNERTQRRVDAEQAWFASGLPVHLFRLSGIYGAGRDALTQLQKGTAKRIEKPGQYFSRIHVADITNILEHSIARPNPFAIYNCADDLPCAQEEVISYAAKLLQMEPPALIPFDQAQLSDMAQEFYSQNRRVRNQKIKDELQVSLLYPTYKEGLNANLDQHLRNNNAQA